MGLLKKIFEGGEESIVRKCNEIVAFAKEANGLVKGIIGGKGNLKEVKKIEESSDDVAFEIMNIVTGGGIAPNLIDNILQLIDKEDTIVDSVYNLAREYSRYKIKDQKTRSKVDKTIGKMVELGDLAMDTLYKMQNSDKIEVIKKLRAEIEKLEEEVDDLKDYLFDMAYNSAVDFKTFYHIVELAHKADDILDSCEDSSDIYLTIMSSMLT